MHDALACRRCGIVRPPADAYIADLERSCERTVREGGYVAEMPAKHDWVRKMHPDVDVV